MISSKLKNILKRRKITQKELADKINVSEKGIALMIRNNSFKVETLKKISEILHIDIDYWFKEDKTIETEEEINQYPELRKDQQQFESLKKENELLQKRIEDKETIIKMLMEENANLRNKLEDCGCDNNNKQKRRNVG